MSEDTIDVIKNKLQFCPVCGNEMERNLITNNPACFTHGDFLVRGDFNKLNGVTITFSLVK